MLTFFALGDWGQRGSDAQRAVAQGMARAAVRYNPRFILTTGDNFYDHGVEDVNDPHWQESFADVYDDPALSVPWYAALGNHDHEGTVAAQVDYADHDLRWRMPERYYSFSKRVDDRTHAQFVILDTTPFTDPDLRAHRAGDRVVAAGNSTSGNGTSGTRSATPEGGVERLRTTRTAFDPTLQRYWLRHMLAPSRSAWKIVVGHHPIQSGSAFHGPTPALQEHVAPLLQSLGVHAYLCGHEHDLQHIDDDGLHHVVSGAGAEVRPTGTCAGTRFSASTLGFAVVTLTADAMRLRFCDAEGAVVYETLSERAGATVGT
jgi:acid phosphatase